MSLTYSVTAWGFEASRASTSSALRSDFNVFFVPKAAVESAPLRAALVMSAWGWGRIEWGRGGRTEWAIGWGGGGRCHA